MPVYNKVCCNSNSVYNKYNDDDDDDDDNDDDDDDDNDNDNDTTALWRVLCLHIYLILSMLSVLQIRFFSDKLCHIWAEPW